ncbi:hypothetical protein N6L27_07450 [Leisingera sp. SS27]|uniref:hypothetical protein n=1 Tax=Leisingera sp. SS27 TaxID=2979462 RepID=UPI00232B30AF|nr:hypothetical protein [Leisingera sp. SS27]MDC0657823.1 hypothetical protein [Leisingera sp. SS27]
MSRLDSLATDQCPFFHLAVIHCMRSMGFRLRPLSCRTPTLVPHAADGSRVHNLHLEFSRCVRSQHKTRRSSIRFAAAQNWKQLFKRSWQAFVG